jgi:hypothetical protein
MVEKLACENDRRARTEGCNVLTEEGLASFAKPKEESQKLRNERAWNARNLRYLPALLAYIRHGDRPSAFFAF